MTRSNNYQQFMAYLTPKDIAKLKSFSKKHKVPMTHVVREAITAKLANGSPYTAGFNAGIDHAAKVVSKMQASQMRFPSGASFAELVSDELTKHKMIEGDNNEEAGVEQEPVSGV